ncbi:EamA family transporter RarD [Thalassotalea mangrovi]|uniref:EamA family transporter RarD n=1 Tax=Thalassotalea mangrovi TaxID=2572245 RepID=A0A4U1B520_9GAMM|nr:EamA family transporter RarD [Thalassotalea mangrovi]TKB45520.1 EamA family transporter RarD [Thalassotalea mangrovi]
MSQHNQTKSGVINAICAYTLWGIAPIYFKLIQHISASEILMHRIVWSFALLALIILVMGKWSKVQTILSQPKTLMWLGGTALILAANWLIFIWAVNNGHILEASLGYYINPLLNVALGMIFLGERLSKWQIVSVALALIGVMIQLLSLGSVPVIALSLAASFGIYGLLRKKLMVDSLAGLFVESAWLLPIALLYWMVFLNSPTSNFANNPMDLNTLLIAAGIVTTAPLLFFTGAAKRLTLATLGFFQYIGPSIMFVIAISVYQEPLVMEKLVTFGFIWSALVIYSLDSYRKHRNNKKRI